MTRRFLAPPHRSAVVVFVLAAVLALTLGNAARAQTAAAGFTDTAAFGGLIQPTAVRFALDGRIFVAEKQGTVKVFPSLGAASTTAIDVSAVVHNYWDRGLLGLALDPQFPVRPYVYVLYDYNAPPGGTAPTWLNGCPTPPGALGDGCVITGRVSRFQINAQSQQVGAEQVLITAQWCQQFPSHSLGHLAFGPDGALYVSAGEGANMVNIDYGQYGGTKGSPPVTPANPCGDPPGGIGVALAAPDARGGSLRAQRLISPVPSDPAVYNGTILRVDPDTGAALPSNPLYGSSRANADRIVAFGLRNPFRFTIRPGTNEIWIADVGWDTYEEIDRLQNPVAPVVRNFGWPCYEGPVVQGAFAAAGLTLCQNLYNHTNVPAYTAYTGPYYAYKHTDKVVAGESCPTGSSSITGITFYNGGAYPASYVGALFFADYSRSCIWAMLPGSDGLPDPTRIQTFVAGAPNPVDLQIGPGGDLFYIDYQGYVVHRVQYTAGNHPPVAVIAASPASGPAPLTVSLDGSGSYVVDAGDTIAGYSWDLNGDGVFGDSTVAKPTYIFPYGSYLVSLRVTDARGLTHTAQATINSGNTPPVATILSPAASLTWSVDQKISFSGQGTDTQDGAIPASSMHWAVLMHHCPSNCHIHTVQTFDGVVSGSFPAPDHDYPSYLELQLTVVDSAHASTTSSVNLYAVTTTLSFDTVPSGLPLGFGPSSAPTPFARQVIVGSRNTASAPSPQFTGNTGWLFSSWSDGGAASHDIVAPPTPGSYKATYAQCVGATPTVTGVTPASQVPGGNVSVSGTGFAAGAVVTFDGTPAPTSAGAGGSLLVRVPSAAAGKVFSIAVQNPQGCPSQQVVTVTVLAPRTSCGLLGLEPLGATSLLWRRRARRRSGRAD